MTKRCSLVFVSSIGAVRCHSVGKFVKRTWTLLSCFGMLVAKELGEKHAGKPNIQYVLDTFNTIWSFLGTYDDH